jgi:8-oxo-dGTP diphosphatase
VPPPAPGPLPQAEYEAIYAKVPRLTVEVVVRSAGGVLLTRRDSGPCRGLWHLPGGTVRYGEPLADAVRRVAYQELGLEVTAGALLGYIEYPSHFVRGIDWPVGIAFAAGPAPTTALTPGAGASEAGWFSRLPPEMHQEQCEFLRSRHLAV